MVALGCKYLRICHLNNCATGVATQNKILRMNHFSGSPERVVNYFKFVAQDVREILASLGFTSLNQIIGRTDLLKQIKGSTLGVKGGFTFTMRLERNCMRRVFKSIKENC